MKLTIIFKDKFEEYMKKQFGPFTNPQVYHVKFVHIEAEPDGFYDTPGGAT